MQESSKDTKRHHYWVVKYPRPKNFYDKESQRERNTDTKQCLQQQIAMGGQPQQCEDQQLQELNILPLNKQLAFVDVGNVIHAYVDI